MGQTGSVRRIDNLLSKLEFLPHMDPQIHIFSSPIRAGWGGARWGWWCLSADSVGCLQIKFQVRQLYICGILSVGG